MPKVLKFGVVGCGGQGGGWAQYLHGLSKEENPLVELIALCDIKVSFPVADNGCFPRLPNYYKPEF